ncbi:glycosyltransferase [Luteimonas sp. TWI1416]|uniref:glycosyltransferase n=1 Tax=unclassified Luteimonas TaxID=2629088 RepID=UPI00320B6959
MKIALLASGSSIHAIRWANGLQTAGAEVHLVTQHPLLEPLDPGVRVHSFPFRGVAGYFLMAPGVRRLLADIRPDVVNAHYASGYGTTARLVNHSPWLLSIWGSDVYDFPYKSPLHRWLVTGNLRAATRVASTSHCMASQARRMAPDLGEIEITPFGVDFSAFQDRGARLSDDERPDRALVIGTVKTLSPKYGIDTLISAYAIVRRRATELDSALARSLRLRIVGGGPQLAELQILARSLDLGDDVTFVGRVNHGEVPTELGRMDVFVALSRLDSESFGVAAIEAGAASLPVVVSDAGGLPEVVVHGQTGIVVPREDPEAAADAIMKLVIDPAIRRTMGAAGWNHVQTHYAWPECVETMLNALRRTIDPTPPAGPDAVRAGHRR